jgi:hypothetical protein
MLVMETYNAHREFSSDTSTEVLVLYSVGEEIVKVVLEMYLSKN